MVQRILFNFFLALEGINANKLRSFLTALGIIFGVGAVIAMLAIGMGAKQAILEQMKLIGTNNIVIESILPSEQDEEDEPQSGTAASAQNKNKKPYSPGLTLKDVEALKVVLPTVDKVSRKLSFLPILSNRLKCKAPNVLA